jgi:cell division protein FtsB
MVTLRGRTDPLKLMGRRLLILVLTLLVVSCAWAVWNVYHKNKEAAELRREAETQLADLQQHEAKLEADYEKLKTARGLEEELRQEYAVGAAGESMIVIVEPEQPAPVEATSSAVMQWIKDVFSHW